VSQKKVLVSFGRGTGDGWRRRGEKAVIAGGGEKGGPFRRTEGAILPDSVAEKKKVLIVQVLQEGKKRKGGLGEFPITLEKACSVEKEGGVMGKVAKDGKRSSSP